MELILENIKLRNFRVHKKYKLEFNSNPTLILGENGSGKTSVLEALYIAMQGKSFRSVDREILRRGADGYKIELNFMDGTKSTVVYDGIKKTFTKEDKQYIRLPKKKQYPIVLFQPEDLNLVGSSPAHKRKFFDSIILQLDAGYTQTLTRYEKALRQRNELLKQDYVDKDIMFSWNVMLAKYGVDIRTHRARIAREINKRLTEVYQSIAKVEDKVELRYISHTATVDESIYLQLLSMDFERDHTTGHTNFGVHRDDYEFYFNGVLADGSASRGEVRSTVIALKFIEADMLYHSLHKRPIVLLDDVFSELDDTRKKCLVKNFKDNQIILTSVK